jgi:hypothetical protein
VAALNAAAGEKMAVSHRIPSSAAEAATVVSNLQDWLDGTFPVMVVTVRISVGVHNAACQTVVICTPQDSLSQLLYMMGRCGQVPEIQAGYLSCTVVMLLKRNGGSLLILGMLPLLKVYKLLPSPVDQMLQGLHNTQGGAKGAALDATRASDKKRTRE